MSTQVFIIDFHDSFTYNIVAQVHKLGLAYEVWDWKRLQHQAWPEVFMDQSLRKVVIYGPGPGLVDDYLNSLPSLEALLGRSDLLVMGICLGHQLIWQHLGLKLKRLDLPYHGQARSLRIPAWQNIFPKHFWHQEQQVQHYNSWYVQGLEGPHAWSHAKLKTRPQLHKQGDELVMGAWDNVITYQFHPESIGTSCPKLFFSGIQSFVYNRSI